MEYDYDVIVVGGGAAGMSAALILGRALRRVLVCDQGNPRNRHSQALHGFITRDGISPREWLTKARQDVAAYDNVDLTRCRVNDVARIQHGFLVYIENCEEHPLKCRKLLIATGVSDVLPPLSGLDQFYGTSIFHCPYCDGYERAGKRFAAYGQGEHGRQIALELLGWTDHVTLVTDGPHELDDKARHELDCCGIKLVEAKIAALSGSGGQLQEIAFIDGSHIACDALFFKTRFFEKSLLATKLGCNMNNHGLYETQKFESTNVPGLFVAGDASDSLHLVIEAAASGAEAAFAINTQLLQEEIARRMRRNAA